jgi:hypothetical protein
MEWRHLWGRLSVPADKVLDMGTAGFVDSDQARQLVRSAMNAVTDLRTARSWKIGAEHLPVLAGALDGRAVGAEQVRTIVATMGTLPTAMPVPDREWWEEFLVERAGELDPGSWTRSPPRSWTPPTPTGPSTKPRPGRGWNYRGGPATPGPA